MVDYHINHEVHVPLVQGFGERNQVIRGAKVGIELVDILRPVTVVSFSISGDTFDIGNNG